MAFFAVARVYFVSLTMRVNSVGHALA